MIEILLGFLDLLSLLDAVFCVTDIIAWCLGRPNREERREARRSGETPPPWDLWTWLVVVLTPSIVILTTYLVWRWWPAS